MPPSSIPADNLPPRLRFRIPPEPAHLLRARERLRDYLRQYCTEHELSDDLVLCVEEACTNAIRHSGAGDDIEIALRFEAERLVASVRDRGRGFDVAGFDARRTPDPSAEHGRGLFIIAALMDSLELRLDGGLEVRMTRRAAPRCLPLALESGLGEARATPGARRREARTRALLEEIDEAFFALDWEYHYVYANQAALGITGKPLEELLGRTPWEVFPQLQGSLLAEHYRAAMELGLPSVFEHRSVVTGDWLEVRIYPTPAGVSAYYREINDRKLVEQERETLIAEQGRQAQLSAALNAINDAASARLESSDVMQDVLRLAGEALGCDAGHIAARDADVWTPIHVWNMPADLIGQHFPGADVPYAGLALTEQRPIPLEDYRNDPLGNAALAEQSDVGAMLAIPLIVDDKGFGCLFFTCYGPAHSFSEMEIDFARKAGAVAAHALENARLLEAELEAQSHARRELETTKLLSKAIGSLTESLALADVLDRLARVILEVGGHSRVAISLWQEDLGRLEVASSLGEAALPVGLPVALDDLSAPARRAISEQTTTLIDYDALETGGRGIADSVTSHLALDVPLFYGDRFVGLLATDDPGERREFGDREIELIEGIAAHAAVAIENARLFEEQSHSEGRFPATLERAAASVTGEADAARLDEAVTGSRATRLVRRLRAHPWRVLVATIALESAILAALGAVGDTRRVLGVPGSLIALMAVVAGALAGPLVGALVAVTGSVVFFMTVADYGSRSSVSTTVISTAIWLAAGLVSGFLARDLREQTERRRAAAVALARADADRQVQLAEQARIEELAAELQAQTEELQARGEELQSQSEELQAQTAELGVQAESLAERAQWAEALNTISATIHSALDFDHVMQRALEQGADALATEVGTIELREQGSWVVRYRRGLSDAEIGLRLSDDEAPCATRAAASHEPFTIADLTEDGSLNAGLVASCHLRSVVAVPLIVRQDVIGCLLFYGRRPRSFSDAEVDFARKLGVTVSLALANARLFEVEQAERARVGILTEVAAAAASSLEPARLSQNVLDTAVRLLGATKGSVCFVDRDAEVARHVALSGYAAESLPALEPLPLDDRTLSGRAIITGEVQAPDPGDLPAETLRRAQLAGLADERLVALPLVERGTPFGALGFGFAGRRAFGDRELELCRAVADQLGAALENARLFEAEVTAQRRASAELRNADLLLQSAKLLSSGLDLQAVLDTLARVVLEALPHSRVTVQLWDASSRTLTIAASHGSRAAPRGAAIAFDQTSRAFRDMLARKATAVTDFDALPAAAHGLVDEYASRLHLGVPLVAGQELIGVLVVDDPGERRPFGEREIALLEAIAAQAATAIENARVFEQQRRIAQTLQENFIHPLPEVLGLELGVVSKTAYQPELVGGDFSDVFVVDDTHVVVLIGDVAGKGVRAAGLTETVRSKIRALATIDPSPAFILGKTNELLLRFNPDDPHVTAFLAVLDPHTGHLGYASAGHPAPVHLAASAGRLLDVSFGPPLGSFVRPYTNAHATLGLDDYLVLYTDGVTEARRGRELLGAQRLLEVVGDLRGRSAQEVADGVRDAALAFAGRLRDDLQVVVLRLA